MIDFRNRALPRTGLLGALLVAATLGLAAALAYHAVRAAAVHRAALATALEHHSTTVAWRFARDARSWVGYGMNEAADALQRAIGRRGDLPGPDILQRVLAEKYCDCMTAGFGRTFVRVVPGAPTPLDGIGEPLSERAKDDLRAQMLSLAVDTLLRHGGRRWRILPPGSPRLNRVTDVVLLWRVSDEKQRARAVYGMVVERAQLERPLKGALDSAEFFPSALVSRTGAKSLVHVEVAGPNGARL